MAKEYIDRQSIYDRVKTHTNPYGKPTLDFESGVKVLNMIKTEFAADVVEVRYGEIIETIENGITKRMFSCCGEDCTKLTQWVMPNYCPNCGAKIVKRGNKE